jgi:hypothetical protein
MKRIRGGVITLSLTLIGIGISFLGGNLGLWNITELLGWWPVILISLGIEILVRQVWIGRQGSTSTPSWDRASIALLVIICILMGGGYWVFGPSGSLGVSWAFEQGFIPPVEVELHPNDALSDLSGVEILEISSHGGRGGNITIRGETDGQSDRIEVNSLVTQPGPTAEKAAALAKEWDIRIEKTGKTALIHVKRPINVSSRMAGRFDLDIRVPSDITIKVDNQHGSVTVRNVATCSVNNRFGEVDIEGVRGNVTVTNAHGQVSVTGPAEGTVDGAKIVVGNEFGPVNIIDPGCPIMVTNKHNEVDVWWTSRLYGNNQIYNEFGPVRIALPAEASLELDAETRYGEIQVGPYFQDQIHVHERDRSSSAQVAQGTIGEGGPRLTLRNEHGEILIDSR